VVKLALDDLRDLLVNPNAPERLVDETIRDTERVLLQSIQQHPDEQLFLQAEAEFGTLVGDNARALKALERAFEKNSRDPFIASRLASIYERKDDTPRALKTVLSALESNRGDKTLNFRCASLLRKVVPDDTARITYHLRRSFAKWDNNFEAQFWFARYGFESDNPDDMKDAKEVFRTLREVPMQHASRVAIRDKISRSNVPVRFSGTVTRKEAQHGFVARDGSGDWIFFHIADHPDETWRKILPRTRMAFEIGFSLAGVRALTIDTA
jgi:tetratricopeptide (TPR) repeat protein